MAGRGAEQEELKPIHGIDLGTWLQKKLENLSTALDELNHACREARDFASHFRVSYCSYRVMNVRRSYLRIRLNAHGPIT